MTYIEKFGVFSSKHNKMRSLNDRDVLFLPIKPEIQADPCTDKNEYLLKKSENERSKNDYKDANGLIRIKSDLCGALTAPLPPP
jgi:hypothetical protein